MYKEKRTKQLANLFINNNFKYKAMAAFVMITSTKHADYNDVYIWEKFIQKVITDYVTSRKICRSHCKNCIFITQLFVYICNMLVILHTYYDNSTHFTKDKHAVLTAHI